MREAKRPREPKQRGHQIPHRDVGRSLAAVAKEERAPQPDEHVAEEHEHRGTAGDFQTFDAGRLARENLPDSEGQPGLPEDRAGDEDGGYFDLHAAKTREQPDGDAHPGERIQP